MLCEINYTCGVKSICSFYSKKYIFINHIKEKVWGVVNYNVISQVTPKPRCFFVLFEPFREEGARI